MDHLDDNKQFLVGCIILSFATGLLVGSLVMAAYTGY